jgi:acetyl esterase/lipase
LQIRFGRRTDLIGFENSKGGLKGPPFLRLGCTKLRKIEVAIRSSKLGRGDEPVQNAKSIPAFPHGFRWPIAPTYKSEQTHVCANRREERRHMRAIRSVSAAMAITLAMAMTPSAQAQMPEVSMTRAPILPEPNAIPLYAGVAPGSEGATQKEVWTKAFAGEIWIRNITKPTLTPFLPKKGTATGAAVLVVPGGGFRFVSMSNEGTPIAQWLAARGIAAFVLKYRVDETPDNDAEFGKAMMAMLSGPVANDGPPPMSTPTIDRARMDAQTALKMIRANATKWGVDTKRVGMMGFSAGAMTTMATTLANDPDARPDFIAPIYGFMTPVAPPPNPQPMFAAMAGDDPLFNKQGFGLIDSWRKAGGNVEFHYYSGGGHGFGSHKKGTTSDLWFDQFIAWMKSRGLLAKAK